MRVSNGKHENYTCQLIYISVDPNSVGRWRRR